MSHSATAVDPSKLPHHFSDASTPTSAAVTAFLYSISPSTTAHQYPTPEIKQYSDATYQNFYTLGVSLCFLPSSSSVSRVLTYVDLFNPPTLEASPPGINGNRRKPKNPWDGYSSPVLPIVFRFPSTNIVLPGRSQSDAPTTITRPSTLEVHKDTTGREFVSCFGEPSKKGGGQNIHIPPFLEWDRLEIVNEKGETVHVGVMVELRDPGAQEILSEEQIKKGAGGLWERAARWPWVGLKLFKSGSQP